MRLSPALIVSSVSLSFAVTLNTCSFLASSLSGYIFFREYAPEAMNPILYTLAYNGGYIYAEFILTVIFISIPQVKVVIKAYKVN